MTFFTIRILLVANAFAFLFSFSPTDFFLKEVHYLLLLTMLIDVMLRSFALFFILITKKQFAIFCFTLLGKLSQHCFFLHIYQLRIITTQQLPFMFLFLDQSLSAVPTLPSFLPRIYKFRIDQLCLLQTYFQKRVSNYIKQGSKSTQILVSCLQFHSEIITFGRTLSSWMLLCLQFARIWCEAHLDFFVSFALLLCMALVYASKL